LPPPTTTTSFSREEPVTGGTGRNAAAHVLFFRGNAEIHGRSAGADDQRVAGVDAAVAFQHEGALVELGGVDVIEDDLRAEAFGVALEPLHQFGPLHAIGVGRPVVHLGRGGELAAHGHAGDQRGLKVGARGIDRGGVTGRTRSQDQQAVVLGAHQLSSSRRRPMACSRLPLSR